MYRGCELTTLYQASSCLFGPQRSNSFASFLQGLALNGNQVAQTFFRQLQMQQHTCIPPPPNELPRDFNDLDSEAKAIDPVMLEARRALHEGIAFQQPSFFLCYSILSQG